MSRLVGALQTLPGQGATMSNRGVGLMSCVSCAGCFVRCRPYVRELGLQAVGHSAQPQPQVSELVKVMHANSPEA